jgi:hypothetical protein
VLSISLIATGCSAQWMSVALADLPVLIQMALNISTIVTTLQSGQQISAAEAAAIQNISAQASKDLNMLATLYNEYKTNPSASALQKIQVSSRTSTRTCRPSCRQRTSAIRFSRHGSQRESI